MFGISDITTNGTITTQNLVPTGTATAGSAVSFVNSGRGTLAVQVTGTYTGELSLQVSIDGTNWITRNSNSTPFLRMSDGALFSTIPNGATGIFQCEIASHSNVRITALTAVTGTATVYLCASVSVAQDSPDSNQSAEVDAFGRSRVSNPVGLFDSQFTNDLQLIQYEQITAESGATITHDTTNRNALMTFSSTPTGGKAFMQTYRYFRYQPSKSQQVFLTFNFIEAKANTLKFAGYSDGVNGIEFQNNGTTNQMVIYSSSGNGNQTITQSNWNLDKLDGTGASGKTLDITKSQIFTLDFQALYTGRVRVGFDIDGKIIYAHEFLHANEIVHPFIATANLPLRCGMTCTGTVSTTMKFTCASVSSEGGSENNIGYEFSAEGTATASSGARTHILSVRPKTTFNSLVNRAVFGMVEIDLLVTGTNPILWELVLGQAISGTTTFNDVNTTYSSSEFNTLGTISGSPAIVIDSGYVAASNQSKGTASMSLTAKYPISLDAAGLQRSLGTISILVTGLGGTSACRAALKFHEIR